ncbi:uncharacterized protein LOC133187661 [Saccostrea echinata]|uniref:uncharacterized protein LOC133187661 n=1 Tax=Saccostrea echinata TaxID=191078 RepID=UPI002A7FF43A|nr:uncharacterized protein LOC133187661 [Saccostrea echinata]
MVIPSCNKHPSYKLDTFCRQCSVPLCLKCWTTSKVHLKHTFGYMKEFIDIRKKEILAESDILESDIIPALLNKSTSLEKELTDAKSEFDDALRKAEETKCNIFDDVNTVFTTFQKRMNNEKENVLSKFRNQTIEVKDAHSKALQVLHRNRLMLQLKNENEILRIIHCNKENAYFTSPSFPCDVQNDLGSPIFVQGKAFNLVQEVQAGGFGNLVVDLYYNFAEGTVSRGGPGLLNKAFVIKTIQTKRDILRFAYRESGL